MLVYIDINKVDKCLNSKKISLNMRKPSELIIKLFEELKNKREEKIRIKHCKIKFFLINCKAMIKGSNRDYTNDELYLIYEVDGNFPASYHKKNHIADIWERDDKKSVDILVKRDKYFNDIEDIASELSKESGTIFNVDGKPRRFYIR